jgi:hypothetical protein
MKEKTTQEYANDMDDVYAGLVEKFGIDKVKKALSAKVKFSKRDNK